MRNETAINAEFTKKTIEGRIRGLAAKLYKLAPHPDNPEHRGALFISLSSQFKPAAEYEGMLGSVMLESFLSDVFTEASNDNVVNASVIDIAAEAASEYLEYLEEKGRGKGTFALGEHKTICNQFNEESDAKMAAYLRDLRKRLQIEESIAALKRQMYSLPVYA